MKLRDFLYSLMVALLTFYIYAPIVWIFITSIKPPGEEFRIPIEYLPSRPSIENYEIIFLEMGFQRYIFNSFVVATCTTAIVLLLSSMAAYAIARLKFKYNLNVLLLILTAGMMPPIVTVITIFMIMRALGLLDTLLALIPPYTVWSLPLAVWIMTAYLVSIPKELEDSAKVDGCTPFKIFYKIILPLAKPGLFSAGILTFIYCLGELMFALTLTFTPRSQTLTVGLLNLRTVHYVPWGQMCAATISALLPVFFIVLVFQKWIIRGLTVGALKY